MARKITVLSDFSNDDSLTPEQEQALEIKVDAMLDPEQPESKPEPSSKPKKTPAKKKAMSKLAPEPKPKTIVPVTIIDEPSGFVPDDEKTAVAAEDEAITWSPEPRPIEDPVQTDDVADELETPVTEPVADNDRMATSAPPLPPAMADGPEAEPDPTPLEPVAQPEPDSVDSKTSDEPIDDEATKKYRPPDGPLPFKRAESTGEETANNDDQVARQASHELSSEATVAKEDTMPVRTAPSNKRRHVNRHLGSKITLVTLILLIAVAVVPASRVAVLNLAHVRSSVKVKVVDNVTHAPLSDVVVSIGADKAVTDQAGQATLSSVRLGSQKLGFQKPGFTSIGRTEFIDYRPNTPPDVILAANGRQYVLNVVDSVSQQLVTTAKATAGVFTASGDAKGRILLTIGSTSTLKTATITAPGYQSRFIKLPADTSAPQTVQLVPSGSDFYTLTASGSTGIYQVGLDGQDAKLLLAATGNESGVMTIVPNNSGTQLAIVSSRDRQTDKAGYLLNTLTILYPGIKLSVTADHAKQLKIIGWVGKKLLYTNLQADTSVSDPQRYKLISYDTVTKKAQTLVSTNTFNDVVIARGQVYYAATASDNTSQLVCMRTDGSDRHILLTKAVSTIVRSSYDQLLFMTTGSYYAAALNGANPTAVASTYDGPNRFYIDNPTGSSSAWIDSATGQLKIHNKSGSGDKVIASGMTLTYPIHWINDTTLIYRSAANDYVISTAGGAGLKIAASNANGLGAWQN